MATILTRRPVLVTAAATSVVGAAYYITSRPSLRLDSAYNEPTKTLAFPKTMLFSKQLTVQSVQEVNHDTKKITFELPGGQGEVSGVPYSSAILTQHTPTNGWFPVFRPYTPISDPDTLGTLQLLVKKYPNGRASGHLHSLTPGQTLTVRGPIPGYTYHPSPEKERSVILVAGGAGITPIYSLAKGILHNPADKTKIQLLWGVNGMRDIVLKAELEELEKRFPERLQVTYAVSGPEVVAREERYRKGYVDKSLLQESIARCEKGTWGDEKGTKVFLCGPPKMEDALAGKQGVLGELGVAKKELHRF